MFHIRNDSINDYRHDYTARFDDRRCGGKDGRSVFLHFFSIRTSRLFIARGNFSGTVRLRFPTKLTFRRACAIVYRRRVIDVWLQNGHARAITKCARVVCQKTKGKIAGRRHPGFFLDRYIGIGWKPTHRFAITGQKNKGKVCTETWETCPAFVCGLGNEFCIEHVSMIPISFHSPCLFVWSLLINIPLSA